MRFLRNVLAALGALILTSATAYILLIQVSKMLFQAISWGIATMGLRDGEPVWLLAFTAACAVAMTIWIWVVVNLSAMVFVLSEMFFSKLLLTQEEKESTREMMLTIERMVDTDDWRRKVSSESLRRYAREHESGEYAWIYVLSDDFKLERLEVSHQKSSSFKVTMGETVLYQGLDLDLVANIYHFASPTDDEWLAQGTKMRIHKGEPVPMILEA